MGSRRAGQDGHIHQTAALGQELQERIVAPLELDDTSYPLEEDLTLPESYIRGHEQTAAGSANAAGSFLERGDRALRRPPSSWPSSFGRRWWSAACYPRGCSTI